MQILVWILALTFYTKPIYCQSNEEAFSNTTDPNKDMYVIHAMVYQVGIVTNATDDNAMNSTMGNQEAITLYRTNGSNIDLSKINSPLVTNVTAQSLVGVAPKTGADFKTHQLPWSALDDLTNAKKGSSDENKWTKINSEKNKDQLVIGDTSNSASEKVKRSWEDAFKSLFKRDVSAGGNDSAKIVKGTIEVPKEAGVQSLGLPPLLSLNNNFSNIPVPIPNTSVVHYAKINTLVQSP